MECLENVCGRVARFPARVPGRESTVSPSMTTSEDLRRAFPLEAVLALVALSLLGCFAPFRFVLSFILGSSVMCLGWFWVSFVWG